MFAWLFVLSLAVAGPASARQAQPGEPPRTTPERNDQPPAKGPSRIAPVALVEKWTVSLPGAAADTPAWDAERIYVALRGGAVTGLSLADGTTVWDVPAPEMIGAPEAGDGLVFTAYPRAIQALDARTGEPKWRAEITGPVGAPLFWDNGWLLAITEQGDATMFRAVTGEVLWKQQVGVPAKVRPAAANRHVYVSLANARVVALDLQAGTGVWDARLPANATSVKPLDDRLFVGSEDKFFYCLDADSGKTKWRWRTGGTIIGVAAVDDESVYFLSLDSVLRALDRGNGHQHWKTELPYQPTGGPFLSARLLLVPGTAAELAAYSTMTGKAAGSVKLAGEAAAPPRFMPPPELGGPGRVVVVTGDAKVQLLVPGLAVLPSHPLPASYSTITPVAVGEMEM